MCGLVGMAGDLGYNDELFMKRLLLLDFFRGTDSTGLAAIRTNGTTSLVKAAVNPITMFDMKSFVKTLNGYQSTAFIGHNRAATLGAVNDANAHPYQFGDITGAHNGTLDKPSWERLELEAGEETNTDSAAVFACINTIGVKDTIPLMEKGNNWSSGAWALTWYDKVTNTMNFIRNEHRPLWYAFNKKMNKVYWASEWEMLESANSLTKAADRFEWFVDKNGYSFFPFTKDTLYSINLDVLQADMEEKTYLKNFKGEKLEGRKPVPFVSAIPTAQKSGGASPWERVESKTNTSNTSPNNNKEDAFDDDIADFVGRRNFQVTTQERSESDPLNGFITEARFNHLTKYGCSYCSSDIGINDAGYTIYDAEDCILCETCSRNGDQGNVKLYLPAVN